MEKKVVKMEKNLVKMEKVVKMEKILATLEKMKVTILSPSLRLKFYRPNGRRYGIGIWNLRQGAGRSMPHTFRHEREV
jgi:hypothetical protein